MMNMGRRSAWALSLVLGCGTAKDDPGGASESASGSVEGSVDGSASAVAPAAEGSADVIGSSSPSSASSSAVAPPVVYEREDLALADVVDTTLEAQRASMFERMEAMGVANTAQLAEIRAIFEKSKWAGQGNPVSTTHPMTRAACLEARKAREVHDEQKPMCGAPFMVPVYDPASQKESEARVCIDRYEFPNLPCDYPVTWISTDHAQKVCKALGKRLCDAHEWEGACAGALREPKDEYAFGQERKVMQGRHNWKRQMIWAYGDKVDHARCATGSAKSKTCTKIGWKECGSNTYPAGSFPDCKSPLGVYDQHGNAAEHMLLPMKETALGSKGGQGVPEMKGSWFMFQIKEAHKDDCRWRAPSWHEEDGMGHKNYHLGFRCCKDLPSDLPKDPPSDPATK